MIVNNASVLGWRAQEGQAHYAAAKAGRDGAHALRAMEAAPAGVRVNAVAPSLAMHEFLAKVTPAGLLEELTAREAFGRARRALGGGERDRLPGERLRLVHDRRGHRRQQPAPVNRTEGPMPTVFETPADLASAVGKHLGESAWLEVTQERINLFADATDDHQWIHVDPARAKQGPFGAPIAHGYLTLSLVNRFLPEIVVVHGVAMGVNYGVDKVRFPSPVKVGARIRGARRADRGGAAEGRLACRRRSA